MALFSFLLFVTFYLSILFMQRKAEEAYSLTSTLTAAMIPGAKTMGGKNDVLNWIDGVVTNSWVEPQCGDGRCEAPFEFPEYGRFGCKADCNIINSQMNITKIQIDLYYNFSHPKGSVSPIDLMNDAKWNLCPLEMDENIGPKKIFHGADCYYEEDQGFEDQVGHIIRKIDDVPDGDWTIVVKKDIFLKVAGAVRPRVNVTKEATHKRLLMAAHYAQTYRKIELDKYNKILSDLAETNATHAHDKINITFLINSQNYNNTWKSERDGWNKTLQEELAKEEKAANSSNATLIALMEGELANSTNTKEEAMIWRRKARENNDTMVDWALRANGYCQTNFPDLMNSTRYKYGFNHSNAWTANFSNTGIALGNTYPDDNLFNVSMLTNTTCRCVPVAGIDECFCYEAGLSDVFNATEGTCDKCAKAKELACAETMRWIMRMWDSRLKTAFTQNVNLRTDAKKDADDDFELVKSWLSSESPVTFFEINQIKGTDPKKLEEASLDTLKDDNVINEYNLDPGAAAVVAARQADLVYKDPLIDLITARRDVLADPKISTPIFKYPALYPFNFTQINATAVKYVAPLFPGYDLTAEVDLDLVEFNPAVLERKDYAFMTCNLEDRADSYAGQCTNVKKYLEDATAGVISSPVVINPENPTAAKEPVLKQFRFQKLCHSICYCGRQGCNRKGWDPADTPVKSIVDVDGDLCVCEMCLKPAQYDYVDYPLASSKPEDTSTCKAVSSRRKLLQEGAQVAESVRPHFHRSHHDMHMTRANVFGRRHLLQDSADDKLTSILDSVKALSTTQTALDTKIEQVKTSQQLQAQEAADHHADTSLETIIKAGFDDMKRGQDALGASLEEILAKQQQALAAAQESLLIQQRTNALADSNAKSIEKLAKAVEKQRDSINSAYCSGAFADVAMYIGIQEQAIITRELKAKENFLSNMPCQMKVMYYPFSIENFQNAPPPIAYRERFIGMNNRVLAGMLVYVERKNLQACDSSRFDNIDKTCSGGRDISSYGVDPVFKMGSPLFKADYLNEQTMLSPNLYNCTEMANPEAGIYPTYNNSGKWVYEFSECAPPTEKCNKCASVLGPEVAEGECMGKIPGTLGVPGNCWNASCVFNPTVGNNNYEVFNIKGETIGGYCKELFNPQGTPYGFRHKNLPGYAGGFPYFFDINLSSAEARRWLDVMIYGLMIDDVKTEKVTAQVVVYNAELGYFGNVMVFFEFTDGGKIEVSHSVNTIRVELYETPEDWGRFAMEVLLAVGAVYSVYEEVMDFISSKKTKGSYMAYFASMWNYIDVASIAIHLATIIMWFIFSWSRARAFEPDIHYDIYKNIEASAFITKLRIPNEFPEMGDMFLEMKNLVDYMQLYMTLSGINIILILGRILKLMDFQPRLGVITHTLSLAFADLMHFFVIFIMVFMGYAFIGHVIFGFQSVHFSDMTHSTNSLFQNLLGDITYFLEDFKNASGITFFVGMIYFYSFNIFVFMILFNFLLAIICDAFGEVKANAAESVSVVTELVPMLRDSWRTMFKGWLYKQHVPEARVRRQLRIWKGENPDEEEEEAFDEDPEPVFKYGDKELDMAGLKRVLRRCVIETYQKTNDSKFLLTTRVGNFGKGKKKETLATADEIDRAARMLMDQVGQEPEDEGEDEAMSEVDRLQQSLTDLLRAQERLITNQVKVIEGQARMAERQDRLSSLEEKILGVLEKPPA